MDARIYRAETDKPVQPFVNDLAEAAGQHGFFIHNESKMPGKQEEAQPCSISLRC